jgi:protein-S-isoprenylcysteine O-methyltransferase Ste14
MGWVFILILADSQFSAAFILMISNPGLLVNRAAIRGKRDLDRIFAGIMALFGPAAMCIVAGLNRRFGWSPEIPFPVPMAGIIVAIFTSVLTVWAMSLNKFFKGVLRIVNEKRHTVCAREPYSFIRHPGYLGAILFDLATPIMLNSMWALIPALITTCIIVPRTSTEDKALRNGLNGF